MYIKPLSAIIDSHAIIHHSFTDDLQLQMSAPPDSISELLHSMQSCICDVKSWATANMLKLNDNKTELMLVTSNRSKHLHNLPTSITIGNAQIPFKQSVKNLGFTLDCHLTMNAHVSNIGRTCYFEQRRLASIRRFLTSTATATLVSAFALSRIDYCSSLLFGSTHDVTSHLQRIQNYAARVILRLPMSSSITIHLKSLHLLPVKDRSTYNIACLCYHCLSILLVLLWQYCLVVIASALENPGTWVRLPASVRFFICSVASFLLCCPCEALEGPISTRVGII